VNKNKFGINIKIEGRVYPLQIDREDEEKYRLAAKMVNETVLKFRELYRDNDSHRIYWRWQHFRWHWVIPKCSFARIKTLFIEELKNLNDDISDFLKEKKKK
jgi:cell division protein ZapA